MVLESHQCQLRGSQRLQVLLTLRLWSSTLGRRTQTVQMTACGIRMRRTILFGCAPVWQISWRCEGSKRFGRAQLTTVSCVLHYTIYQKYNAPPRTLLCPSSSAPHCIIAMKSKNAFAGRSNLLRSQQIWCFLRMIERMGTIWLTGKNTWWKCIKMRYSTDQPLKVDIKAGRAWQKGFSRLRIVQIPSSVLCFQRKYEYWAMPAVSKGTSI